MQHRNGYSSTQIGLHWIIAILILFNYIYSDGMGRALRARIEGSPATELELNPAIHVWVGVAVLVLTLIRLALRETRGVPEAGGTGAMQQAAILQVHIRTRPLTVFRDVVLHQLLRPQVRS